MKCRFLGMLLGLFISFFLAQSVNASNQVVTASGKFPSDAANFLVGACLSTCDGEKISVTANDIEIKFPLNGGVGVVKGKVLLSGRDSYTTGSSSLGACDHHVCTTSESFVGDITGDFNASTGDLSLQNSFINDASPCLTAPRHEVSKTVGSGHYDGKNLSIVLNNSGPAIMLQTSLSNPSTVPSDKPSASTSSLTKPSNPITPLEMAIAAALILVLAAGVGISLIFIFKAIASLARPVSPIGVLPADLEAQAMQDPTPSEDGADKLTKEILRDSLGDNAPR